MGLITATNPKGWEVVKLDKITTRPMKTNPSESCAPTFRYIDIASIDSAIGAVTKAKIVASVAAPSRARQLVAADDVLVSTVRPNLRGSAYVPEVFDGSIASTGFAALRPVGNHINPKYLFALIRCDWLVEMLSNNVRGVSYPAVTDSFVRSVAVPLPPLPLQTAFAAQARRIEAMASTLDAATTRAEATAAALSARLFGQTSPPA